MNMRIKTRWGQISIDPEKIYEVHVHVNPWENIYRATFVLERSYENLSADMESINELVLVLNKIENEIALVKQYKHKDQSGQLVVNESRRLELRRGSK